MVDRITPSINLNDRLEPSKISTFNNAMRLNSVEEPAGADFKSVMSGLVENLNTDLNAPDELVNDLMADKADIHDVMAAIAKSEIQLNIATTSVGKVIQAYDKIMNISI